MSDFRSTRVMPVVLLVTALLCYPFLDRWLQAQTVHAVTDAMIYVLLALGLNIVVGYAGMLDLGYAAFVAIGAYTMGLLNSPVLGSPLYGHVWSFWVVIWIAAAVSAGLGVVIGAPTLRVRGDYLAIITLAFGEIIPVAIRNMGDITIDIAGWKPVQRLNLTGGENGVNPVGRPHLPFVNFDTDFIPWYFLILVIGALSLWAMNRMRDSRLGRAWMAIREDETAADCTGVNPVKTKLLAFALGASFSGFAGSFYAAKLQAITPGAFEFNVSIMLLCMVVLGGMGSLKGVILGGMLITLFDRILLSQMTFFIRWVGRSLGIPLLASVDLTLWRWFFFGLGLVIIMLIRPEGLMGRRVRPPAADVDEGEETLALVAAPPRPRAEALPAWLREAADLDHRPPGGPPVLEVRGLTRSFDHRAHRAERCRQDDLLQPRHGTPPTGQGRDPAQRGEPRRAAAPRHRRSWDRAHLPVDPSLPEHERARQRAGGRALPAPRLGGGRGLPAAHGDGGGSAGARPCRRSPRLRGTGRQGR